MATTLSPHDVWELVDQLTWRVARDEGIPPAVVRLSLGIPEH